MPTYRIQNNNEFKIHQNQIRTLRIKLLYWKNISVVHMECFFNKADKSVDSPGLVI